MLKKTHAILACSVIALVALAMSIGETLTKRIDTYLNSSGLALAALLPLALAASPPASRSRSGAGHSSQLRPPWTSSWMATKRA